MAEIEIIYEDEAVLVCRKPAGVATQTKRMGQKDMESMLKNYRVSRGEPPYIGVVHRLDQPVSGVMVFAKTKEAAADLSRQIATKLADKNYYAMTEGIPAKKKGTLTDYLRRDGKTNTSTVVDAGTPEAKRAELSYEVIEEGSGRAVLDIRLLTGRHHQIRVQLSHAGIPIVGDRKYNFKEHMTPSGEGLALCSYQIGFKHPVTHRSMNFKLEQPFHITQNRT
jgi:23S rRNA pseudouridine1911/1915/1917 synthase